ncbi:UDP-N-acetylglucosamine--N-acetylmuramyl-(pentapeptide) pyrophosphoryl-undecaprenol N-acetylglucosamine transferase [Clarias magur]|uniref:UDP-N-acetylglucosamine--N-acetylmuramyl-(Pentapeptide) pyrophosphoryl-undecaprenol N-acetylglucosamine transferase n=1 Tax=Clarias magur TaxID=1594786 RepID=A0A8J4TRL9_CLAMG|nr:UDP-N-acetylglucosamine--N-acetylmuramyl-(pentapeptide) pyrophosphoryl-undecaprenol N-acetylglucosamine transferase [Clarias magur]
MSIITEESHTAEREFPPHLFHYNAVVSVEQEFPALVTGFLSFSVFPALRNSA